MATQKITLPVKGMTCASCVRTVEKGLSRTPGVDSRCSACHMNMASGIARKLQEGQSYTYCENCTRFLVPGEG